MSNIASNRNSTPVEASHVSLRPPQGRAGASGLARASADVSSLSQAASRSIRPASDIYGQPGQGQGHGMAELDPQDQLAQQWIADIDQYEKTLEEMAAATLDQDFKDELSAIEQWFRVLTDPERTAALYALLQQTTQVQVRFFIQVLQQIDKNHPMSGVLSPANFDKDPMSNRLSDAMNKLSVNESARNSLARNSSTSSKRQSGLDSQTIRSMFPDAAAAISAEKAKYTQQTGAPPTSNRNSAVDRNSLVTPIISGPNDDGMGQNPQSPWGQNDPTRPKSSSGQPPMGQFVAPQAAGLRSPRPPQLSGNSNIQHTTLTTANKLSELPMISPGPSGNWASMVNTPMVSNFGGVQPGSSSQTDMLANAAVMKLAALQTVQSRVALDDPRKFRRARSNDPAGHQHNPMAHGGQMAGMQNVIMVNEHGQVLSRDRMLSLPGQQNLGFGGRSRPSSPGMAMQGGYAPAMAFTAPQNNGFLSAYDGTSPVMGMNGGLAPMNMGHFGLSPEGYLSDHSDMVRGRSPRGRRGSSKPPEDPTDPSLLQDIPSWLRSLRLHKYTDNLKDMKWSDLVELDDKQLEERGVNALGARRKMIKVFEQVKEAKEQGKLG